MITVNVNITDMGGATELWISDTVGTPPLRVTSLGTYAYGSYSHGDSIGIFVMNPASPACDVGYDVVIDCPPSSGSIGNQPIDEEYLASASMNGTTFEVERFNVNGVDVLALAGTSTITLNNPLNKDGNTYITNFIEALDTWMNQNGATTAILGGWVLSREFPQSCEDAGTPLIPDVTGNRRDFNAFKILTDGDERYEIRIRGYNNWVFVYRDNAAKYPNEVIIDEQANVDALVFEGFDVTPPSTVSNIVPFYVNVDNAKDTVGCGAIFPGTVRHLTKKQGFLPESLDTINLGSIVCTHWRLPYYGDLPGDTSQIDFNLLELIVNGVDLLAGLGAQTMSVPAGQRLAGHNGCYTQITEAWASYLQNRDAAAGIGVFTMYHWYMTQAPVYPGVDCEQFTWRHPSTASFKMVVKDPNNYTHTYERSVLGVNTYTTDEPAVSFTPTEDCTQQPPTP